MATVVSAYYVFPSKFPSQQYLTWIRYFLENIDCRLIFFTTADLIPLLTEMRSRNQSLLSQQNTKFIDLPMDQWKSFQKYGRAFWENQKLIDPEKHIHSPELYAIWYEKKEFVNAAIQLNPFQTEKFIWCDAGCFRYPDWFPQIKNFGQVDNIPENSMLLLQIQPFTSTEINSPDSRDFLRVNRIGGGIQAGSASTWKTWSQVYDQQLENYVQKGKFVGKDQSILTEIVLNHPELCQTITPANISDQWFTLLFTLSKTNPLISILIPLYNGIEYLAETCESVANQTYQSWEVLIGVNGWPENSEIYQQACQICAQTFKNQKYQVFDLHTIQGKPKTMNELTKLAKGDWLALLDADDLWEPSKLEIQSRYFDKYDVIGTQCVYFQNLSGSPRIPFGDISSVNFWTVNPLLNSTILLRKSIVQEIPWNGLYRGLEDYELWLSLRYDRKGTRFWNCSEILMKHRIYPQSAFNTTNSNKLPEFLQEMKAKLINSN